MTLDGTERLVRGPRLAVGNLVVEVLEGPDAGRRVETDGESVSVGSAPANFLELTDPTVSGYHLELEQTDAGVRVRDLGSTNGTRCGEIGLSEAYVPPSSILTLGTTKIRVSQGSGATVEILETNQLGDLLGASNTMRRVMARLSRVALADVPVLITGESGTGKELVARAVHAHSNRSNKPFVTVDCGVLSPTLIASELFGHERGAFTGADRQRIGAFERAHGGTLFLDEVGELPAELQPQLLGALERHRFVRVGGQKEIEVDVRVVAATNRDLRAEVNSGTFRMDVYYRLAVVTVLMPALRDRPEDIPLLVDHFLKAAGHAGPVEAIVSAQTLAELQRYRWPGNVRELRNWVEATLAIGEAQELMSQLPEEVSTEEVNHLPYKDARTRVLDDFESKYCRALLDECQGNVSQAARRARMDRSYLIKLLQKHDLK